MTTRRTMLDFPRNEAGLVDEFIGTAYDVVKGVYDNMDELEVLHDIVVELPTLAETVVEAAMVPARIELAQIIDTGETEINSIIATGQAAIDTSVGQASGFASAAQASAEEAAASALEAQKVNQSFPFTFNAAQSQYNVSTITGQPDTTTAGMTLWVEGAIEYAFTINTSKLFTINDPTLYPDGAQMRLIVNARWDDGANNLYELTASYQQMFGEFLDNSDFEQPVPYAGGLEITRSTQTLLYLGEMYRVAHEYLPLTTTSWAADESKLVVVGDKVLRQDLASTGSTPGSTLVTMKQAGDSAITRYIQDKLLEQAVSVLDFKTAGEGSNIRPALLRMIAALKLNLLKSRVLLIPYTAGEWTVDAQTLFDVSDFTLLVHGNVRLSSTVRQKTFLFSSSTDQAPVSSLKNISVLGNGAIINGNGSTMTFSYTHGDGSDNDSTVRFNYVDNLLVSNITAHNGPIDSMSTRQCRGRVQGCRFTGAKEDNGFSATTDWDSANWAYGNLDTYGLMVVEDCWAYGNQDFGMTAFNCSAVFFINCRSWNCRGGFSYEDSFTAPDLKLMDGGFFGCWAFNCQEQGFYITADCHGLDPFCKSWNIRGYVGDNSNGLFENGVVVSNVKKIFIGGSHKKCGRSGVALFNDTGYAMEVTVEGDIRDNDSHGIRGRGIGVLLVKPGTTIKGNGKVSVNASYGSGVNISNSGGAGYLQGLGLVKIGDCFIDDNGLSAVISDYVGLVDVQSNICRNNAASGSAVAIQVTNATTAKILDNQCPAISANQTFSVNIAASVTNGYEGGNSGSGSTGVVSNNSTAIRQSDRGEMYATATYDPVSIAAGSQVATTVAVVGATVGDFATANFSTDTTLLLDLAAVVSTDGNVTVYFRNRTASAVDLASGTLRILVTKRNGG